MVAEIFVEEGESAKTANRPEFKKMLDYCQKNRGKVQALVVYSVNRFARNNKDHTVVRAFLLGLGVTLRSVTEPIEDTSTGRLMEGVLASFSQFDNDVRAERTVAGMKSALQAGQWTFKAPLGYLNVRGPQNKKTLAHDSQKAPLVRQAFELYSSGLYTKEQVLKKITDLGLKTQTGKRLPSQTFNKMLRKPIYAGWLAVNKWENVKRGNFEPIVSQEVFEKVQALITGKKVAITPHKRNHEDFPLRHFTHCEACGRPLTASWSKGRTKKYPNYRCQNSKCKAISIRKEKLEDSFLEHLGKLKPTPESLRLFKAVMLDFWNDKRKEAASYVRGLQKQLEALKIKKERLEEAFIYEKSIDQGTYNEQGAKLKQDITLKELEISENRLDEVDFEGLLDHASFVISNPEKVWEQEGLAQKQRLQKVLFPDGAIFGKGGFGTSKPAFIYTLLSASRTQNELLVALTPTSWNQLVYWLKDVQCLKDSGGLKFNSTPTSNDSNHI